MRTAISPPGELRWERRELPLAHLLHQFLHLLPGGHQLVYLLHRRPAALGDSQPALTVDYVRHASLLRGHRKHDRLDTRQLAVVDVDALELLPEAGYEREHALQWAHLAQHPVARQEVVERELALAHALLHLLLVHLMPAGRVDNDHVVSGRAGTLETLPRGDNRVLRLLTVDRDLNLAAKLLQLVDRRRALEVGGHESGLLTLLAQEQREL